MTLTIHDLEYLLKRLKELNEDSVHLDCDIINDSCESIDFDLWKDNQFQATILTVERED